MNIGAIYFNQLVSQKFIGSKKNSSPQTCINSQNDIFQRNNIYFTGSLLSSETLSLFPEVISKCKPLCSSLFEDRIYIKELEATTPGISMDAEFIENMQARKKLALEVMSPALDQLKKLINLDVFTNYTNKFLLSEIDKKLVNEARKAGKLTELDRESKALVVDEQSCAIWNAMTRLYEPSVEGNIFVEIMDKKAKDLAKKLFGDTYKEIKVINELSELRDKGDSEKTLRNFLHQGLRVFGKKPDSEEFVPLFRLLRNKKFEILNLGYLKDLTEPDREVLQILGI